MSSSIIQKKTIKKRSIFWKIKEINLPLQPQKQMVVIAQLVRASDCGSEGRGFEPRFPPKKEQKHP